MRIDRVEGQDVAGGKHGREIPTDPLERAADDIRRLRKFNTPEAQAKVIQETGELQHRLMAERLMSQQDAERWISDRVNRRTEDPS